MSVYFKASKDYYSSGHGNKSDSAVLLAGGCLVIAGYSEFQKEILLQALLLLVTC